MKHDLLIGLIKPGKRLLDLIYSLMKLRPLRNKVVMLSRQSDRPSRDFRMLAERIGEEMPEVKVVVLCKAIPASLLGKIGYGFYLLRCMRQLADARVCLVDGYSIPVSLLKQRPGLTVIQLWHALGAVKKFGWQSLGKSAGRDRDIALAMNMHGNYDHVLCASEATGRAFAEAFNVTEDKIAVLGMPRIDYIKGLNAERDDLRAEFLEKYPESRGKEIVLYAPTFRGGEKIDVSPLASLLDNKRFHFIVKLHPLDDSPLAPEQKVEGFSTYKLLQIADHIITDYSALLLEASLVDKPVYLYVYDIDSYEESRGLNIDLLKELPGCASRSARQIAGWIEKGDYDLAPLRRLRDHYITTDDLENCRRITDFIRGFLEI